MVKEEGQGIKRMSFRSGIKKQNEKLESKVRRKNIKHPRILRDGGEGGQCETIYLNIKDKHDC